MKLLTNFAILSFALLFSACTSKSQPSMNETINSISLDKNVAVGNVPRTIPSPVSIGIGFGGMLSRHVGIGVGTQVRPDISNEDGIRLERAINLNRVSLENLVANEFDMQMKEDPFYQKKYVPFGSNYKIHLYVPDYYLDTATFSSKAVVVITIDAKIYDENDRLIYEAAYQSDNSQGYYVFREDEILNSKDILTKALNISIRNAIEKIIDDMKRN